jgi:hypothetical protein
MITLKVSTKRYQGNISKNATVYTNDPSHPMVTLTIKAFVKVPILLSPRSVYLRGIAGWTIKTVILVRAEKNEPLKLTPTFFDLDEKVAYHIEEAESGRLFKITFNNIPGPPGTFRGSLKLKTNYLEKPEIIIPIRGSFRQPKTKPQQGPSGK